MGRKASTVCADLATKECGTVIMDAAAEWSGGKIDILVLCAAVSWVNFVKDLNVENIDRDYS